MKFARGQSVIGAVWLIFGGTLVLLTSSMASGYSDAGQSEIWQWFLPHVLPTAGIVVATFR